VLTELDTMHDRRDDRLGGGESVEVSFVVIGYNEAPTLGACLKSVREAARNLTVASELIYVDGGSQDGSIDIAARTGADSILGGEKRRRASENRNLGFTHACGRYVQFIDGDMVLAPDWPAAAVEFLDAHAETAAVCGNLREKARGVLHQAMELDWLPRQGVIRHCGGAAMFRRETLQRMGGFPEDVLYGEEPVLCWRIRNELRMNIYQLGRTMADHDLGFKGSGDYWRRNVRVGSTYAAIAARYAATSDPLWRKEAVANLAWAAVLVFGAISLALGPDWLRIAALTIAFLTIARKTLQTRSRGNPLKLSFVYALHTYLAKLPLAQGEILWLAQRMWSASREIRP
jgi:glycosyltransferase involved in cell wall biosynthesis